VTVFPAGAGQAMPAPAPRPKAPKKQFNIKLLHTGCFTFSACLFPIRVLPVPLLKKTWLEYCIQNLGFREFWQRLTIPPFAFGWMRYKMQ
jgi:hypothetical protein